MKEVQTKKEKFYKASSNLSDHRNLAQNNVTSENISGVPEDADKTRRTVEKVKTFGDVLEEGQNARYPFFTEKAFLDMSVGRIPDFESLYHNLSEIPVSESVALSAIQFLPALRAFTLTDEKEIKSFINNPETNHVIVQNDLIKIVLIRWNPGDECNIHGHAERGCVFKVLQGKIVEKRFSADDEQRQLAQGTYEKDSIAYIDDLMGFHCVGNPFTEPAITLHMYTPGNYKPSKK